VKQKEEIKKRYNNVHVIYLSATPIPRTLYQAISDLIKISVIETPPQGRLSVNTEVLPYDENRIIDAVNFELKRGGQIYYVYNRVEFMERKKLDLQKLLPGVRIASVNGQIKGDEIEDIMIDFMNKKYDLLLASTIIESGIDIPSVNTLIVEDAHKMGLSQLYQLRGRVGREKKKAYCYLFYPKNLCENEEMNSGSLKRLFALEEFSELGSGFRLAMRDLEIRGAGDLLGTRQHGFINAVGLDMYLNLLEKEIKRIKGFEVEEREKDVLIDLKISAFIPPEYINDDMERLNFYKRLYSASTDEIDEIVSKMKDMAGPIPPELENLVEIIKIKNKLKNKGVEKIIEKNFVIEFYFSKDFKVSKRDLQRWQKYFNENIRFFKTSAGDGFEIRISSLDNKIDIIKKVFEI
jgi:transcription-repair coupling factor (superfamily II helicase)